ncbi:hypothetical protein DD594_27075, partial [Enterobacter cloacae complex sp. 4DZ1-17B1]
EILFETWQYYSMHQKVVFDEKNRILCEIYVLHKIKYLLLVIIAPLTVMSLQFCEKSIFFIF